jgi:hypothetical protein
MRSRRQNTYYLPPTYLGIQPWWGGGPSKIEVNLRKYKELLAKLVVKMTRAKCVAG